MVSFIDKTKLDSSAINFLKLSAIFFMSCDHIGRILLNNNLFLISLGRIAFPLFAFILVHNYLFFTSDKKKYIFRLFILGLISQPVFIYALNKEIYQLNIFFTLSLGLATLYFIEQVESFKSVSLEKGILYCLSYFCIFIISIFVDYSFFGIAIIILFYFHFERQRPIYEYLLLVILVGMNFSIPIVSFYALFSFAIINFAYQKEDFNIKNINKYFYYYFYPVHLIILFLLNKYL